jgi:hypothetical protein
LFRFILQHIDTSVSDLVCLEVRCRVRCMVWLFFWFQSTLTWLSWLVLGGSRICSYHLFCSCVTSACHSFCLNDRSIASSKANSPHSAT